jgi:TolB-like protein
VRAKSFTALLTKELGVAPEPATAELIADIRNGRFGPRPSESAGGFGIVAPAPNGNAIPNAVAASIEPAAARHGWRGSTDRWGYRRTIRYYSRRYGILIGCVGALAVDSIIDAGVGPLWEKLFGATPALGEHATSISSQSRSIGFARTGLATSTVTPQHAPLPLLVIAFREEGDADRVVTDGFTDELIGQLSRYSDIKLLSRETANLFLTRSSDVTRIGAELGAPYVVKTSVHRQADSIRINIELIDASTGSQVWSERAEAAAATLEDNREISTGLADRIHVKLSGLIAAYAERATASRSVAPDLR